MCGIPQGSCLGPLLYSIFVNDMPKVLQKASMTVYADDTTIHVSAPNLDQVSWLLQKELTDIHEWIVENRLKLNIVKSKCMTLGTKQAVREAPRLQILLNNQLLEQVTEIKLLGVTLDQTMSWKTHINNIVSKMSRNTSLIKCNANFMSTETRKLVLQSLVLCHLDYCSSVWSCSDKKYLDRLQIAQNRAARVALGCPFRTNVEKMHQQLSWMKVKDRQEFCSVLSLHKIWTSHKPFVLFSELQPTSDRHKMNTRQAANASFSLPRPKTEVLKKTFMYRTVSKWNTLPPYLRHIKKHYEFKVNLRTYMGI